MIPRAPAGAVPDVGAVVAIGCGSDVPVLTGAHAQTEITNDAEKHFSSVWPVIREGKVRTSAGARIGSYGLKSSIALPVSKSTGTET